MNHTVANDKDRSGKRSNASAHKIDLRVIIRSFHRDHFTLSLFPFTLAAIVLKNSKRDCCVRPGRLPVRKAGMTVSN